MYLPPHADKYLFQDVRLYQVPLCVELNNFLSKTIGQILNFLGQYMCQGFSRLYNFFLLNSSSPLSIIFQAKVYLAYSKIKNTAWKEMGESNLTEPFCIPPFIINLILCIIYIFDRHISAFDWNCFNPFLVLKPLSYVKQIEITGSNFVFAFNARSPDKTHQIHHLIIF